MARIFLDTNVYIDAIYRKPEVNRQFLDHEVYYSPLATHILYYSLKLKVPQSQILSIGDTFEAVDYTKHILHNALSGPTPDLEDNIQLHSSADAECDYFLTNDKKLLAMKFFGKAKIVTTLS